MFKSKHIKLPASVGPCPPPSQPPHSSQQPLKSCFQEWQILSSPEACQEETDCGPILLWDKFFLNLYDVPGTFQQLFLTHLHACSETDSRRTQIQPVDHTRRQDGTANKPGLCERFDQTGKAWGLKASVQANGCHGSHTGQSPQLQKYADMRIHQAKSASTPYLWGLGRAPEVLS